MFLNVPKSVILILFTIFLERYTSGGIAGKTMLILSSVDQKINYFSNFIAIFQPKTWFRPEHFNGAFSRLRVSGVFYDNRWRNHR